MALNFPNSPADGDTYEDFYWDATAGIWRRKLTVTDLADLNDTEIVNPLAGESLVYNGTKWVNQASGGAVETVFLLGE